MASAAWERRNARARELGYESYYDYRVHGYGKRAPSEPVDPDERTLLRGHRGAADLERTLSSGRAQLMTVDAIDRRADGTYRHVQVTVITSSGRILQFRLHGKGASNRSLATIRDAAAGGGVTYLAAASIDAFGTDEQVSDAAAEFDEYDL